MQTDAQLIRAARRDADAFGELYRRHAPAIHAWFRRRTDARFAEDLTAETFAQAALSLRRFRDDAGGSAAPWLFGIARNLLARQHERRRVETRARRKLGMPVRDEDPAFDEADERASAHRLAAPLGAALASLPAGQREALELRVVEELPYRDVASTLGCSEPAARLRVMRALESLTRMLKEARP
jgi:RNA polymerase sigma-70 factor (ECF subfamily)